MFLHVITQPSGQGWLLNNKLQACLCFTRFIVRLKIKLLQSSSHIWFWRPRRCTEHRELLDRGLALVCRFGLRGQDTCLLCLLSVRLSVSVSNTLSHTPSVTSNTPGLDKHSYEQVMVQTKLLTLTLSPMCDQHRERGRLMRVFLILDCVRKAAESHVAWKPVYLMVCGERWGLSLPPLSYSTSQINIKSPHSISAFLFLFFNLMRDIKCQYTIIYATDPFSHRSPFYLRKVFI